MMAETIHTSVLAARVAVGLGTAGSRVAEGSRIRGGHGTKLVRSC